MRQVPERYIPERHAPTDDRVIRNPVLHDIDPDQLMAASDELRERTMALEPRAPILGLWIASVLISVVAAAVYGTFRFREEIRAYLGLG